MAGSSSKSLRLSQHMNSTLRKTLPSLKMNTNKLMTLVFIIGCTFIGFNIRKVFGGAPEPVGCNYLLYTNYNYNFIFVYLTYTETFFLNESNQNIPL